MRRARLELDRRRLQDGASSRGVSGQSGGVCGSWGAWLGAAWYWGGGGGVPRPPLIRHIGLRWRRRLVVRVECLSLVGLGLGGPFWRGRGGWGVTGPGTGGWPLVVGGVWGWSAQLLPSHTLVLLVHGGLWRGGVGWWAVVVVGVVFKVVVVGPLVVVALVVVGMVQRVWP